MTSLEGPAATDPSSVAQQVAVAQSASVDPSAQHPPSTDVTNTPLLLTSNFGTFEVDVHPSTASPQIRPQLNVLMDIVKDDPDRDSALGDDSESFTTSIKSAVTDYKYEHGRRYHAYQDGKYVLPNDDAEINRLELQHRIWQLSLSGRLNLAPLPPVVNSALDIGCGTGAWAIEFAEAHPECRVIGCDLSPIQPIMVPPNVEFLVDDITSEWLYPYRFQYIHSRGVQVGIRDWHKLVDECWRNLEPGGWVEFQEYHAPFISDDGSIEDCPAFKTWNNGLIEATKKAGTHLDAILGVAEILRSRGFTEIGEASTKWPLGPWAKGKREKKVGVLFEKDIATGLEGVSMRMFTRVLGWSPEDVQKHIKDVEAEIYGGRMHSYMPIDFVWAQKPRLNSN